MTAEDTRTVVYDEPVQMDMERQEAAGKAPAWFDRHVRRVIWALVSANLRFRPKETDSTARVWVPVLWRIRTWRESEMQMLGAAAAQLISERNEFPAVTDLMDAFRTLQDEQASALPPERPRRLAPPPAPSAESLRERLARHPEGSPFRRLAEALLDGPAELAGARVSAVLAEMKAAPPNPPEPAAETGDTHDTP